MASVMGLVIYFASCVHTKNKMNTAFDIISPRSIMGYMGEALKPQLTSRQYGKLADWGERVALVGLGSLVVQQIAKGVSVTSPSVILGALVTGLTYLIAYSWLKQS